MNLLLVDESDFTDDRQIFLRDRRFVHVKNVLQAAPGDTLRLGRINGPIGEATVLDMSNESCTVEVRWTSESPKPLPLTMIIALPRPKSLPRILQTLTSLGVKNIYFTHAYKVAKDFWSSDYLSAEVVKKNCLLGLEQAADTVFPRVHFRRRFKPFVEDELPSLVRDKKAFVAHPYASESCPSDLDGEVVLALGPEGGWIDYEIGLLKATGFTPVSVSSRILRLETAVAVLPFKICRTF